MHVTFLDIGDNARFALLDFLCFQPDIFVGDLFAAATQRVDRRL